MLNWFDLYSSDIIYCLFQTQGNSTEVLIYAPTLTRNFDPNLIVIFVIAVSNIFIGGYFGGLSKHKK